MGNIFVEIPPPANWQDFELLTLDMCRQRWKDDYAERNGREGQAQSGVDVFGYNYSANERTGVQCKKRKMKLNGVSAPSNSLTTKEVKEEIRAAKTFSPKLDRFIIATTAPRDVILQEHVRKINSAGAKLKVSLWFWDDFVEYLNSNESLMYRYYENVLKYRNRYSPEVHYYRMLALAFDRPAIRTSFRLENRATDFIDAISLLQQAISTGILKDRDGHVVDQVRTPDNSTNEIKQVKATLQRIRTIATEALKRGIIVQHETVLEIKDHSLQEELNQLRRDAVKNLNILLDKHGIEPINITEY
ncbi:MAG: hypothetical protein M3362_01995 [Acidobacteriota bacterium]|nr:hypothetical protein [Acidobacteriota bacterium]